MLNLRSPKLPRRSLVGFMAMLRNGVCFSGVRVRLARIQDILGTSCIESLDFLTDKIEQGHLSHGKSWRDVLRAVNIRRHWDLLNQNYLGAQGQSLHNGPTSIGSRKSKLDKGSLLSPLEVNDESKIPSPRDEYHADVDLPGSPQSPKSSAFLQKPPQKLRTHFAGNPSGPSRPLTPTFQRSISQSGFGCVDFLICSGNF